MTETDSSLGDQNICRFTPLRNGGGELTAVNFIYETEFRRNGNMKLCAYYTLNIVTEGIGELLIYGNSHKLQKGDVFFVFPATPYDIVSHGELRCLYVGYLGTRAVSLMEDLQITKRTPVFPGHTEMLPYITECFRLSHGGNVSLLAESVLLYSFAAIGADRLRPDKPEKSKELIQNINKYVGENYSDPTLSLRTLSRKFSYSEKYLSALFKKEMNTGFTTYLNTVRIRQACKLMDDGFTSVKDISRMCGFSEQTYFSKKFRAALGTTPSEYIKDGSRR